MTPLETRLLTHLVTVTALLEEHARFSDNEAEKKACKDAQKLIAEVEA